MKKLSVWILLLPLGGVYAASRPVQLADYYRTPEATLRGEPDGTFKLLFNSLFYGAAKPGTLR